MTCRDCLHNPVYCRVSDAPQLALDIMNLTELPAIPVVIDHQELKVVGLVRASRILATNSVGEVLVEVRELVEPVDFVAHADASYHEVAVEMERRGLASVPVVDDLSLLVGTLVAGAEPEACRKPPAAGAPVAK